MPGRAKVGKQKSASNVKKRFKKTGKGLFAQQKAAHNHLLQQKSKKQKRLANKTIIASKAFTKKLRQLLPNK